jgi:metal-dependent amidase/aminoacylase/carboxypeptidase family protein
VIPLGVVSSRFSEDFGSFQEVVPGTMFLLGVSNREQGWVGMPHSPGYVADEAAVLHGGIALAAVLLARLRQTD